MMKTTATVDPVIVPLDALSSRSVSMPYAMTVDSPELFREPLRSVRTRIADFVELTKPKIAVMALFTVAIGYLLGAANEASVWTLCHVLLGSGLVAAGGSALNQWIERDIDSRMNRTRKRPLPAGRIAPGEAYLFGVLLGGFGLAYLYLTLPIAACIVAAITFVSYFAIYTPLKTITVWNTMVGAVPGALPPVIGWTAARGWESPWSAFSLFLVIFLWQIPHFLAIAWMYRDDYARGGLRMLPGVDHSGVMTSVVMVATCGLLVPAGVLPLYLGIGGWLTVVGSALAAALFLRSAIRFARTRSDRQARNVLRASLLYLPAVLGLLLIDTVIGK